MTGPASLADELAGIIRDKGLIRLPEPVALRSGAMSQDFVDAKRALADGADLELACRAIHEATAEMGIEYDAVGGLTLGADQFAHGLAVVAGRRWFVVRKAAKGRGTNQRVEGAAIGAGVRALVVDDVVTEGGSIKEAYEVVRAQGATVAGVIALVDRSDRAAPFFESVGVPYRGLVTYRDLGIEPVRFDGLVSA